MKYDIIIIGAGPAGLMAARELSKAKINYLLIESNKKIGLPLRCGEGIRQKEFVEFFKTTNYNFVRNIVKYHEIKYNNITRMLKVNFLQLDRPKFEQWLSKRLNIKTKTTCSDIKINKQFAEVITTKGNFKTKLVILSYGCNFHLQNKLGMNKKKNTIVLGYGGIYEYKNLRKDTFYYLFDKEYLGYLWIFPKTDKLANIGFGAFGGYKNFKQHDTKQVLSKLLKKYNIKAKQKSQYAGIVPCSGPIERTYNNHLLICGSAAGQVYAGTGEGIYFALKSGTIAGRVAAEAVKKRNFSKEFLRKYELLWKKSFGRQLQAGIVFAELLIFAFKYNVIKNAFRNPTEKELKQFVLLGKTPLRVGLFRILVKHYNLISSKKTKIPLSLRIIYKISKFLHIR